MKVLSQVVILIFIHCCTAANRTTIWYIANNQIYSSSGNPLYQWCNALNPTQTGSTLSLYTGSKLSASGTIKGLLDSNPTLASVANIANTAILTTITITFTYNSTYSLTLALPASTGTLDSSNVLSTATTSWLTASPSTSPLIIDGNKIQGPTGSTWLYITFIQDLNTGNTQVGTGPLGGMVIVDYVSSSTIAVTKYTGGTNGVNTFYSLAIRSATSSLSTATILSSGTGCTSSGRKRSVEHVRNKRAIACSSMTSLDPSLSSSTISSLCTNAASSTIYSSTAGAGTTNALLTENASRMVNVINSLYIQDVAVFGAAGSKFSIFTNFGILVSISTILFSYLY